jgi:fluoroacetyl-CoA thioesterase
MANLAEEPGYAFMVGQRADATQLVTSELAAAHLGSGSLQVYATPAMVRFVEHTCRTMIEPLLPAGQSTVGVDIHVKHLAPTPVGGAVHIQAEITGIEGNLVNFQAELRDDFEQIGMAEHRRAIIDIARFQKRIDRKAGG